MICLNKADEDAYKRLSWNQSPEPLAPESTTRQDMNGITNLRELVAGGQDADDAGGGGKSGSGDDDEKWHHAGPSPGVGFHLGGAGRWFGGMCLLFLPSLINIITRYSISHLLCDCNHRIRADRSIRTILASQQGGWR
jgi:hypothetical protein